MNELPPDQDETDDVEDLYRRAAALDNSRPSELVRRRVLNHAAQLAAQRGAQNDPKIAAPRARNRPWRRPAIFGTLAAAALAGLLIAPHFLPPRAPDVAMESQEQESRANRAAGPAPAPAPQAPTAAVQRMAKARAPEGTPSLKDAPAQDALSANAPAEAALSEPAATAGGASADADGKLQNATSARRAAAAPMPRAAPPPATPGAPLPLHRAAAGGDISGMQRLLDEHSDVDARDAGGRTPLMAAVVHGQAHAVEILLAHGADPNAADARGTTPLQAAIAGNRQAIAVALRRAGAR